MKGPLFLPRVYPITDRAMSRADCHSVLVRSLGRGGAKFVQLREKGMTARRFFESAVRSVLAAAEFGMTIIINDDPGMALAVRAHGVHLGDEDLPPDAVRRFMGPDAIMGVSSHGVEEALRLSETPCDYVALGPIFATTTKLSGRVPLGPEAIAAVRARVAKPIVAIGGIGGNNLREVLDAGADSAAVVSDIMKAGDPGEKVAFLLRIAGAAGSE